MIIEMLIGVVILTVALMGLFGFVFHSLPDHQMKHYIKQ